MRVVQLTNTTGSTLELGVRAATHGPSRTLAVPAHDLQLDELTEYESGNLDAQLALGGGLETLARAGKLLIADVVVEA